MVWKKGLEKSKTMVCGVHANVIILNLHDNEYPNNVVWNLM